MSDLKVNQPNVKPDLKEEPKQAPTAETGGILASATNTPSPLFNAVPSSAETGGVVASSSSSSTSNSSGSVSFTC